MKKAFIFILFGLLPFGSFAVQDTLYLNRKYEEVARSEASEFHVVSFNSDSTHVAYTDYNKDIQLVESGYVLSKNPLMRDGIVTTFHKNGEKASEILYVKGEFEDILCQWDEEGKQTPIVYDYARVDVKPVYPGGDKALLKYMANATKYPEIAKEKGFQGKVYIRFIIDEQGAVTHVKVVRGVNNFLDEEAVRVVSKMPDWTPGEHKGKKVSVYYIVPLNFKLY